MGMTTSAAAQVKTSSGLVEGAASADGAVRMFKGIPFAAPPVGELRWRAPRPVAPWSGVRKAAAFGARCMQGRIFSDMIFRDEASEDCLYLNVWTPTAATTTKKLLPVMFWIPGGAFQAGSASEPRQDGERLARKGVVVVSANYRLGVFGFFAHPELTREAETKGSGNYALLDMIAALQWVQANISAFGGDPRNVTIFGESAGSFAVSGLMASPLTDGLFNRAIGESGAFFNSGTQGLVLRDLAASEARGTTFAAALGTTSIAELRAKPAEELLQAALKERPPFWPTIDGHVLPMEVHAIYAAGKQRHMPLLAGWNADESRAGVVLAKEKPTAASFSAQTRTRFGDRAEALLQAYPAATDAEALESAASLASDLFIGYNTWKWIEMHAATGRSPVYRYSFDRKIPVAPDAKVNDQPATSKDIGARHAGEIEYVFGTLDSVPGVTWEASDRTLSDVIMTYWTNFARTGDPSGDGLPKWPRYSDRERMVLHLDTTIRAAADAQRARYELLDSIANAQRAQSSK
jgi:para-nitrobenzyl esterase